MRERAGTLAVVLGVPCLAATVFVYVLSLTDLVNPPNWVRAAGLIWLPIGFFGTPIIYVVAHNRPDRHRAAIGLGLSGLGLLAFVVLLFAAG